MKQQDRRGGVDPLCGKASSACDTGGVVSEHRVPALHHMGGLEGMVQRPLKVSRSPKPASTGMFHHRALCMLVM